MATWSAAVDVLRCVWMGLPGARVEAGQMPDADGEQDWGVGRSRGQSMVEYVLIFFLVVLGLIVVLLFMGPQIANEYHNISNNL